MKDRVSVAVTGGIGSGKSTTIKILKELNYPVFSCDEISKELSQEKEYLDKLNKIFPSVFDAEGRLDKIKLAQLVFNDENLLKKLNDFSHPIIMEKLQKRVRSVNGLVFSEVPLLFEGKFENDFDFVIIVLRDLSKRIESVCARDCLKNEQVLDRIKRQFNYEKLDLKTLPKNQFFVWNNEGEDNLKNSIKLILNKINS